MILSVLPWQWQDIVTTHCEIAIVCCSRNNNRNVTIIVSVLSQLMATSKVILNFFFRWFCFSVWTWAAAALTWAEGEHSWACLSNLSTRQSQPEHALRLFWLPCDRDSPGTIFRFTFAYIHVIRKSASLFHNISLSNVYPLVWQPKPTLAGTPCAHA